MVVHIPEAKFEEWYSAMATRYSAMATRYSAMATINTKCYVMNNEEKLFQQKQSLETLFLLMKKTRAKKFKVRMFFYHLQSLFWGFCVRGFLAWRVFVGGFMSGGFCPDTLP